MKKLLLAVVLATLVGFACPAYSFVTPRCDECGSIYFDVIRTDVVGTVPKLLLRCDICHNYWYYDIDNLDK